MELCQVLQDSELTSANGSIQRVSDLGDRLHARLATEHHARLGRMLKMEERVCSHSPNMIHDHVMLDGSLLDAAMEETIGLTGSPALRAKETIGLTRLLSLDATSTCGSTSLKR